ncbi:O-antigen polysaccharide polymerase Wzy [Microbacterium imperiale]|uniref:O-antigen polysaccharide polymerase Wzy n=1 Tax=Microbacterium imperiale TaxID=33884 RepID=UPI001AE6D12D|nr:O-antigen polysaccharide polymerase Wzy [Microbacterium imperiale]MBP2419985.1 hypothetical protein [Microbacterium imperiale]MDS0198151.1 O-antigen polysaccharide polymerase Wzy [Microbacterium imperiale]
MSTRTLSINPWAPPLALVAIAIVVVLTAGIPDAFALLLASVSAIIALIGAISSASHGLRPASVAFYVFWFSWLGVGPIVQLTLQRVSWGDTVALTDRPAVHGALLLTVLGVAAFWVGSKFADQRHAPSVFATEASSDVRPKAAVRGRVVVLLAVALLALSPFAIRVFGFATYFSSRNERALALRESGNTLDALGGAQFAMFTALPIALAVSTMLLSLYQIQSSWNGISQARMQHLITFTIGLAGCIVFANPLSQTRFIALTAFGTLAVALFRPRSRGAAVIFVAAAFFAALIVYPLATFFRGGTAQSAADLTAATFTGNDFDGFQQVINTIHYVDANGFTFGIQLLSAALFFIPRSMWAAKADPASIDVATHAGYAFTNLSMPIHAELYMQFGVVGVAAGMLALGYFTSRVDAAWMSGSGAKLGYFAPYLAMVMFGLLRGPLGSLVPIYMPTFIVLAIGIAARPRGRSVDSGIRPGAARHEVLPRR